MFLAVAFITCLAGGILPIVNADAFVVAAALVTPDGGAAALIAVAAAGQVVGKLLFFLLTRHCGVTAQHLFRRRPARVDAAVPGPSTGAVFGVFVSALIGVPPFFVVTAIAAAGGMTARRYAAGALPGRVVRTTLLVLAPRLLLGGGS